MMNLRFGQLAKGFEPPFEGNGRIPFLFTSKEPGLSKIAPGKA